MRTHRLLLLTSCAIAAMAATPVGAPAARRHRPARCDFARCRTLAVNAHVRVYQQPEPELPQYYVRTVARWLPSGRTTTLGDSDEAGPQLGDLALSGRFIAYGLVFHGRYNGDGTLWKVVRMNVATGHREEAHPPVEWPASDECVGERPFVLPTPGVKQIVVDSRGTVAWLTNGRLDPTTGRVDLGYYRVCAFPLHARNPTLVAAGDSIEPGSLAIAAGRIYWTERGLPRSATAG